MSGNVSAAQEEMVGPKQPLLTGHAPHGSFLKPGIPS